MMKASVAFTVLIVCYTAQGYRMKRKQNSIESHVKSDESGKPDHDAKWCYDFDVRDGCSSLQWKTCPATCKALYEGDKPMCSSGVYRSQFVPGHQCNKIQRKQCPNKCLCIQVNPDLGSTDCNDFQRLLCKEQCGGGGAEGQVSRKIETTAATEQVPEDSPSDASGNEKPDPAWCSGIEVDPEKGCSTLKMKQCPVKCRPASSLLDSDFKSNVSEKPDHDAKWCYDFDIRDGCSSLQWKACPATCKALYEGDKPMCSSGVYRSQFVPGHQCNKIQRKQCPNKCLCIQVNPDLGSNDCNDLQKMLCKEQCGGGGAAGPVSRKIETTTATEQVTEDSPSDASGNEKPDPAWCSGIEVHPEKGCSNLQKRQCPVTCKAS